MRFHHAKHYQRHWVLTYGLKRFKGWMTVLVSYKSDCKNKKIIPELGQNDNLHNSAIPAEFRKELALLITNMILSRRVK